MNGGRIRVLVADDSPMVREVLKDILGHAQDIQLVGEATDGKRALDMAVSLKPDLLILDLAMPVMGGLRVLELLMAEQPTPVLVLSSFANKGSVSAVKALAIGALDVMEKPLGITEDEPMREFAEHLLEKVRTLARIRVVSRPRAKPAPHDAVTVRTNGNYIAKVVAVGASVGGPAAVCKLLAGFPKTVPLAFVMVQHIPVGFLGGFVDWLVSEIQLAVAVGADGMKLRPGQVVVAPEGRHMEVKGDSILLNDGPPVCYCRPAVDVLFKSVAMNFGPRAIGVVLTGMGQDGADGIRSIKAYHGRTLAESEESCVVFGMPKAAIATGNVDRVLPVTDMSREILSMLAPE
ncbi:MAG: chemotaxis-specific protein-glutamate methyltransferase CheB [Candidatus Wallbacteria bacterium]|nr:chemotaxis-specific protein-glutamate methyltransferase CheB [Candidatus Wallbacteria bacterium]